MTKLKAPDHVSGFTYQGVPVDIAKDGTVIVSNNPALEADLRSHGFVDYVEEEAASKAKAPSGKRRSAE
ncbi:MAG: hypothetical protein E6Q97_36720 [Desulfurellales bacterium]|nr:MAG: hypothetical protein E6Q97_36720 [Desulfurellales bacterium]